MAEQTLSELVMNLINWIESLHEKNLKYEAQLESLTKDLEKAQNSKEELEARLSAYQESDLKQSATINTVPVTNTTNHNQIAPTTILPQTHSYPQHQQVIYPPQQQQVQPVYQPVANQPTFASQPSPYMWTTYDSNRHYHLQ